MFYFIQKIKDKLCKMFGHKWTYYKVNTQELRVCLRCNRMQEYKYSILEPNKKYWSYSTMYREAGAKKYCKGYGKE